MAERNLALQLIISAKDEATALFGRIFGYLDDNTKVIAGKIRNAFTNVFGGGAASALELEAQLDRVAAKGGYTATEMAQLKAAAQQLGVQFGVTGVEAAHGMETLAAAGLSAADAIKTLPQVLALAKAEQISTDLAAERLIDSLSVMGLGFQEAGRMADVLAKGADITTSSAIQLAEALSEAGGVARAAGLNLETTVAALDLLHKNGIKGSEAGTALKGILTALIDPSSKASQELTALGITSRDLGDVLGGLQAAGGAANGAILAFGTEAGPGLRALLAEGQTSLNDYIAQLANAEGAALGAAENMGGNLKGALAALESAWDSLKSALLDPLLEPITKQARELTKAFEEGLSSDKFKAVQDTIQDFSENAAKAIGDFVKSFDFQGALAALSEFVSQGKGHFDTIGKAGTVAASVVQIAWNGVTAGFKTIGAGMAELVASVVATLANIEQAASKVGLGSAERAATLRATALEMQATAANLLTQVAQDGADIKAAYDRLKQEMEDTKAAAENLRKELETPPNALVLEPITKTLADYKAQVDQLKTAQQEAAKAADAAEWEWLQVGAAMDQGKASAYEYETAVNANKAAQEQLEAVNKALTAAQSEYTAEVQRTLREIGNESAAIAKTLPAKKELFEQNLTLTRTEGEIAESYTASMEAGVRAAQAELALAQAKGDHQAIAEAQVKVAQDELLALQAKRIEQEKELKAYQLIAERIADLTRRKAVLTDTEALELAALNQKYPAIGEVIAARKKDIAATDAQIETQRREADQVRRMAGPLGELIRLYQDQTRELEREISAIESSYAARIAEQRSIEQVALAKGDEVAASQAAIKILELEADLAEKKAALAQQEADQAQKNLELKTLELLADGALSEADQQQLADLQALAEGKQAAADASSIHAAGMRGEADAAGGASSVFDEWKDNIKIFGDYAADAAERLKRMNKAAEEAAKQRAAELKAQGSWVSSIINGWTQRLGDLSEASEETFRKVALDADATRKSIAGATDATNLMRIATMNLAAGGIIRWANELAIQALEIELSFKGQAQSADRLSESLEKMADEGGVTAGAMAQLVRQAEAAKTSFNLLDQERLDRLQAAIDDVNDKLRQMQEETQSARDSLAEMNAELLEAQGLDAKAELLRQQLDYQQKIADIEAQRQDAELSGNRELITILNEQRKVLEQINRTKVANIEADAAEQAQSRSNTTTPTNTGNVTPINRAGGGKTYNLNLVGVRGQTLNATTDTDPSAFLTALEDAQRRGMIQ